VAGEGRARDQVDPALWQRADMRAALASRDIAMVFRLLQKTGVSQRRIAALTGQSQSEISEILGGRQVVSYDVLLRIADGLAVPRGHLGLAYDEGTAQLVGTASADDDDGRLMRRATELAVGPAPTDPRSWAQPFAVTWSSPPDHVGRGDIRRLEATTVQLRAVDYEYGGGACRDAVLAQVGWAQQLLRARVGEPASRALHVAVADLHLLAGWTSFDIGLIGPARRHFGRALEHARFAEEPSLVAKTLYCLARVHIHHGWGAQAIRLLQLGLVAAQQSRSARAVAMTHANLAWAHAVAGDDQEAVVAIARAQDEYHRGQSDAELPPWLTFFNAAELQALRGTSLAYLPGPTPQQRAEAISKFTLSTALRELPMARSRAFELTMLAWMLVDSGDTDQAVRVGNEALDLAGQIRSQRVIDRLTPLRRALERHPGDSDLRDLVHRIGGLSNTTTAA
jgi:transcriptional regulator with XRE-family HTH domain/tetratricopeptide (TPR) repeat protein